MVDFIENDTIYPQMMSEIAHLYGKQYDTWYDTMTTPVDLRCLASPRPWTYFHCTPRLQVLYTDATEDVAIYDDIGKMIDHLIELSKICKENGRDLYFSQTMLGLELTPDTKKMVTLAFVVGMLQGHFDTDLFCEVEYVSSGLATGDVKITAEKEAMQKVADETGCPAVMLVLDARNEQALSDPITLPFLKEFATQGYRAYRGPRCDRYPLIEVGLWRKPTAEELMIEIEFVLALKASSVSIVFPLWHRDIDSLSLEEEEAAGFIRS